MIRIIVILLLMMLIPMQSFAAFRKYRIIYPEIRGYPGMVGWWKLDDGGSVILDYTGLGNIGTPTGTITSGGCVIDACRRFNGINEYIDVGNGINLNPSAITVMAWVNFDALTNAYSVIYSKRTDGTGTSPFHALYVTSAGKLGVYVAAAGGSVFYDGSGTYTLTTHVWYHLVFTYSSSDGLRGYVNGKADASASPNGSLSNNSVMSARIGNDLGSTGRFPAGYIDDVRVYNRALTAGEIVEIYNNGLFGQKPSRRRIISLVISSNVAPASTFIIGNGVFNNLIFNR